MSPVSVVMRDGSGCVLLATELTVGQLHRLTECKVTGEVSLILFWNTDEKCWFNIYGSRVRLARELAARAAAFPVLISVSNLEADDY